MTRCHADIHRRRSMRLPDYDYTGAGAYFVTICIRDRQPLLGEVVDGRMRLDQPGQIVQAVWEDLPFHYPNVETDAFVVMPNHIHGIVVLTGPFVGAGFKPAPTVSDGASTGMVGVGFERAPTDSAGSTFKRHGLPEIVRALKTSSARRINEWRGTPGIPIWQRNYYEHTIRDQRSLDTIRAYIEANPARWAWDPENPQDAKRGV